MISDVLLVMILPMQRSFAYGSTEAEIEGPISCKCVAFRLDDIQDYYLNQVQIEIIKTFERKDASLTVGVIANYFGKDALLTDFLKKRLVNSNDSFEIANHGWNHEDFTLLDKDLQSDLLNKSNDKISEVLGVTPQVFITPYNRMNNDTITAMIENGIHIVSANIRDSVEPFIKYMKMTDVDQSQSNVLIHHFPTTAKTGDLNDDDTEWLGLTHVETLANIRNSIQKYGYAMVMMHPQEFSVRDGLNFQNKVDMQQLSELELLFDSIRTEGYTIVTISQLASSSIAPEFDGIFAVLAAPLAVLSILHMKKRKISYK
jgi:peptidoglycan/xylan/chitin deacetylase (PgdA/CDA1 family)